MAGIILDAQGKPAAPAAGKGIFYQDSTSKVPSFIDDSGRVTTIGVGALINGSVAAQGPGFAADTYLAGSQIALLTAVPRVGTLYRCTFDVSKSGAGTATPIIIVRFGTLGTTGDTARLTFTFTAQTAVADVGMFDIYARFRTVGAAGVLQGRACLGHTLAATGLSVSNDGTLQVTSAGFDTTVANSIIGISVNGGGSAAWTVQLVEAGVENL